MLPRITRTVLLCGGVVLSMLAFPSALTWTLFGWLLVAWHAERSQAKRLAALGIVFAAFLALLRGPFTLTLLAYVTTSLGATTLLLSRAKPMTTRRAMLAIFLATAVFGADRFFATRSSTTPSHPNASVVCLGDSLTSGVPEHGGYPDQLAKRLPNQVRNFGVEGITADEAHRFLDAIVDQPNSFIVIELGGHDFLKQQSRKSTKADLVKIISTCRANGVHVLLCEIPRGFLIDPFWGLERELAREYDLDLIPDGMIRRLVLFSPHAPPGLWMNKRYHYSDDGLHPNPQGNRMMAQRIASHLMPYLKQNGPH